MVNAARFARGLTGPAKQLIFFGRKEKTWLALETGGKVEAVLALGRTRQTVSVD